jgi:glycosyltransferase involved in cell wall biosynthesis
MRLALVTETFPPEINGVAHTLARWVEAFESRGHTVRVIRPRQPFEGWTAERTLGLPLPFYPDLRFGLASRAALVRLLRHFDADLVHIATEGPLGWAALMAGRELGLPVATSFHTNFDHYLSHYRLGFLRPFVWRYLRWFHNQAAVTLVPSEGTRRRLLQARFRRVEIWSRGVDCRAFHPWKRDILLRQALGLRPDDVLLLYVGRLAPEKNLTVLLGAVKALRERFGTGDRQLRLALVGGGPLARWLAEQNLPAVLLPGLQRGESLARWYASADLFVFPSRSETFGNVVMEAMASGLPVVAFDSPGVNEQVVHGKTGLIVSATPELVEAIDLLSHEPQRRACMSKNARSAAESRAWEPIFDSLEQRYELLLRTHGTRTQRSRPEKADMRTTLEV